jgi:hypothetical protein
LIIDVRMIQPSITRFIAVVIVSRVWLMPSPAAAGVALDQSAIDAYNALAARVERRFIASARGPAPAIAADVRGGVIVVTAGTEDGIVEVPDALAHHWRGVAFIPDVTLQDVVAVSRAYDAYPRIYAPVTRLRVLSHRGDTYEMVTRIEKGAGPISAVLDIQSTVSYVAVGADRVYAISAASRITEIEHAGRNDERPVAVGEENGYLWRAHVFTLFVSTGGGVYVVTETLGLSRRFPSLLAWAIEPVARRLGRSSVEDSLIALRREVVSRTRRSGEAAPRPTSSSSRNRW